MKSPWNILNLDDTRFMSRHVVQFEIGGILKSIEHFIRNHIVYKEII